MDQKLRNLERQALAGDPLATEALLREQQRMGLYRREHYILGFTPCSLAAGGIRYLSKNLNFNFEVHFLATSATAPFTFSIKDDLGEWSDGPINSICLMKTDKYELLMPRFLKKGSEIKVELTDASLASNEVSLSFHGIRTTE
jgi:hypothetical protein